MIILVMITMQILLLRRGRRKRKTPIQIITRIRLKPRFNRSLMNLIMKLRQSIKIKQKWIRINYNKIWRPIKLIKIIIRVFQKQRIQINFSKFQRKKNRVLHHLTRMKPIKSRSKRTRKRRRRIRKIKATRINKSTFLKSLKVSQSLKLNQPIYIKLIVGTLSWKM